MLAIDRSNHLKISYKFTWYQGYFFQNCSGKKVPNVPFLTLGNSQPDEYWWKSNFSNHTKSKLKVFNYSPEFYRQILFELAAWRHFVIDAQQMQHSFFYYSHFSLRWLPHCVKSVRILNYSGPYFMTRITPNINTFYGRPSAAKLLKSHYIQKKNL